MKRFFFSLSVFGLLAGCSTTSSGPFASVESSVAARNYLVPSGFAEALTEDGVRAFIVLDNNDPGRSKKICNAYERLPQAKLYEEIGLGDSVVPVYWPLKSRKALGFSDSKRCEEMISDYSWPVASVIQRMADLPITSTSYLVAMDGKKSFYFDIDDGSQGELDQLLNGWFEYASANPDVPGVTLRDKITIIVETICGSGVYNTLMDRLPEGKTVNDVIGIAYRDGECAAAETYKA